MFGKIFRALKAFFMKIYDKLGELGLPKPIRAVICFAIMYVLFRIFAYAFDYATWLLAVGMQKAAVAFFTGLKTFKMPKIVSEILNLIGIILFIKFCKFVATPRLNYPSSHSSGNSYANDDEESSSSGWAAYAACDDEDRRREEWFEDYNRIQEQRAREEEERMRRMPDDPI